YPCLSCMALDYLTIPATSIDIEHLFSCGHLLLSHVHSQLSVQSTHALLCLGIWSELNLVKNTDVNEVSELQDTEEVVDLEDGWDRVADN
ncbi:hypothetical protein SCLCIDRAFT_111557, partial [Scleroderma citrinum Foug A]